jgi:ElaB/YqjD/DUF883 family membrane-anchored ribosome-binding protein
MISQKFHIGDHVVCMYGKGVVRQVRSATSIVVVPSTWVLANNATPVFYLNSESLVLESEHSASISHQIESVAEKVREVVAEAESNAAPVIENVTHEAETFIEKASKAVKETYAAAEEKATPMVHEASKVVEEVVEIARDVATSIEEAVGLIPASVCLLSLSRVS